MLSSLFLAMRRMWLAATFALLLLGVVMLCRAEPEAKKQGAALFFTSLAQTWLFFHDKTMAWLQKHWRTKGTWQKRTVLETLQAVGGLGFTAGMVAVGAFILFAETCLPFDLFKQ